MARTLLIALWLSTVTAAQQFEPAEPSFSFLLESPAGLPSMPKPDGYVPTEPMFALGKRLFHVGFLHRRRPQKTGIL